MAKVTSKLQVTIPRHLAREYDIKAGDEVDWSAAGDAIRIAPARGQEEAALTVEMRLKLFDAAMKRQKKRERAAKPQPASGDRGWRREDLYDRGRTR